MTDVKRFQICSRQPSRGRGPVAVRAAVVFMSFCGRPQADLAAERSPRHTPPRCSPHRSSIALGGRISARLSPRCPIPSRSVSHTQGPAVSPPGFLNTAWRSGFADSKP